ncbi:hypothetical protein ONZ45_g7979 [Pleurotus djamor]|nr:hypothetical protein ONZ45_g7979 [Pleurotus djamor]
MIPQYAPTRIVASCDAQKYDLVDVTGAPSAASIRERIFSKLNIPDYEQSQYNIFPSEIGRFAIGLALTDEMLVGLCRQYRGSSGALTFFVSPYHDRPSTIFQPRRTPDPSGRRSSRRV